MEEKNTDYYFIKQEQKNVGFIKIKDNAASTSLGENSMELEKIYVLPSYKGLGIGKIALSKIIEKAKEKGYKKVFLSVIDTNINAIAFYEK